MAQHKERALYHQLAKWLQLQHPTVKFRFDLAADLKLTVGQAKRHKDLHPKRGYPDLWIARPTKRYHGLYIELKADDSSPFKKDGTLKSDPHLTDQFEWLMALTAEGYAATFSTGFDETVEIINKYLRGQEI